VSAAARLVDYLDHILRAIERIGRYTVGMDEPAFHASDLVQDAVIRNIEIIGEAANKVLRDEPEFAGRHADIPWQVMYSMRNRVSHGYDKVDVEIVWKTLQHDLPGLYQQIEAAKAGLPEN
jgi:uncharacterized protein with HEPN domain